MTDTEPLGYEFKFNGCYYWTEHTCGGPVHYRELFIMGKLATDVPPQRLMRSEYENAKKQSQWL